MNHHGRRSAHVLGWREAAKVRELGGTPKDTWKPQPWRGRHECMKPIFKLIAAKKYRVAMERVADMLERDPEHRKALSVLIMLHGKLGSDGNERQKLAEIGYAERLFQDAISGGMGCMEIYGGMVDAYSRCEMFVEARAAIGEAVAGGMDCDHNYSNVMNALYVAGRYEEIVDIYGKVPSVYRNRPRIRLKYAEALRKLAFYGEAIEIAANTLGMHTTLDERTKAILIISYSEMCRGNPQKAYEMMDEVYQRMAARADKGFNIMLYPRLLCGMVFACRKGGIAQPEQTLIEWRGQLRRLRNAGRGKIYDLNNAITQVDEIPSIEAAAVPA